MGLLITHFLKMIFKHTILFWSAIVSFLLFSVSCKNKSGEGASNDSDSSYLSVNVPTANSENVLLTGYRNMVLTLSYDSVESVSVALNEYRKQFTGQPAGLCDSAYLVLQGCVDSIENILSNALMNDSTDYEPLFTGRNPPQKLLDLKNRLVSNGFIIKSTDGMAYVVQNRKFILDNIGTLVSEPMKEYLSEIERENAEGFTDEHGIIITAKKHADRIIWYENFLKANNGFVLRNNCVSYKKAYLTYMLLGILDTHLFQNETEMQLSPYFTKAYAYILKTYPDSELATIIGEYQSAIEQKNKSLVDDLIKKYTIKGWIYTKNDFTASR